MLSVIYLNTKVNFHTEKTIQQRKRIQNNIRIKFLTLSREHRGNHQKSPIFKTHHLGKTTEVRN